jgi:hypothetical protein
MASLHTGSLSNDVIFDILTSLDLYSLMFDVFMSVLFCALYGVGEWQCAII